MLMDAFDWKNGLFIMAAVVLNCVVCGALMRPLVPTKKPRKKNFFDRFVSSLLPSYNVFLPPATKLRRLCFYTCLSFCSQGGIFLSACWDTTTTPPPGSTPPPKAHTPQVDGCHCIRYASYWNAFLLAELFNRDCPCQWRIQDFPKVGAPTLGGGGHQHAICQIFCMKLHEIERFWTGGRHVSKFLPCRSATACSGNGIMNDIVTFLSNYEQQN